MTVLRSVPEVLEHARLEAETRTSLTPGSLDIETWCWSHHGDLVIHHATQGVRVSVVVGRLFLPRDVQVWHLT